MSRKIKLAIIAITLQTLFLHKDRTEMGVTLKIR